MSTDIDQRTASERMEVLTRAYIAKEMTIDLHGELENKLEFIESIQIADLNSAVMFFETSLKTNILETRLKT